MRKRVLLWLRTPLLTLFKNFSEVQNLAAPNLDINMILSLIFENLKDQEVRGR